MQTEYEYTSTRMGSVGGTATNERTTHSTHCTALRGAMRNTAVEVLNLYNVNELESERSLWFKINFINDSASQMYIV